mgnify:CR=1 FL=1
MTFVRTCRDVCYLWTCPGSFGVLMHVLALVKLICAVCMCVCCG